MKTEKHYKLIWLPRILAIAFILFLALFALDAFDTDTTISKQLIGFFMHLIPNFLLLAALTIAWNHPKAGGLIFFSLATFSLWFFNVSDWITFTIIQGPVFLIAGLFLISWYRTIK